MRCSASVRVERRGEVDVVADVRSEPPMAIRSSGDRILVAGSAAGPLGGDEHLLTIDVGPHAHARIGTVAAQMVLPGVSGAASDARVVADVGDDGCLDWQPEPMISVVGSTHLVATTVRLGVGARCRLVDEIVLGRAGEPAGRLDIAIHVDRVGRPLLRHAEQYGPGVAGAGSAARIGDARHVLTAVVVGITSGASRTVVGVQGESSVAWLPVAGDAALVVAAGPDRPSVRRLVDRVVPELAGSMISGDVRSSPCGSGRSSRPADA